MPKIIHANPKHMWDRDDVQIPRLLAEIAAVGLTDLQVSMITESTGLSAEEIKDVLNRADETFDAIKKQLDVVEEDCVFCGTERKKYP